MASAQASQANLTNDVKIDWMRQYQSQKRVCDEANGVLRSIVKRAKSEGMNAKSLIASVAATKLDPDQVRNDIRDQIHYMALLRMPMTQMDLFGGADTEVTEQTRAADVEWDADDAGYIAGRSGVPVDDCPYPEGTELALHWVTSWRQGLTSIAREMGPDQTLASTSRTRPVRDPSAGDGAVPEAPVDTVASINADVAKRKRGRPRKNGNGSASGIRKSRSAESRAAH